MSGFKFNVHNAHLYCNAVKLYLERDKHFNKFFFHINCKKKVHEIRAIFTVAKIVNMSIVKLPKTLFSYLQNVTLS